MRQPSVGVAAGVANPEPEQLHARLAVVNDQFLGEEQDRRLERGGGDIRPLGRGGFPPARPAAEIFAAPRSAYARALIAAAFENASLAGATAGI